MKINHFTNRITDVWDYPKLSIYDNQLSREDFYDFLNEEREDNTFRLYIHVPFCQSFCSYCQFYKYGYNEKSSLPDEYINSVIKEIEKYSEFPYFRNSVISSIFFGGGDPSILSNELFDKIMDAIYSHFDVSENVSISVEGTAKSLLKSEKLECYKKHNINRISFGVQTFNEELRQKLHIKTSVDEIYRAAEKIKTLRFENFAFDIMYDLPDQSDEVLLDDIEQAVSLGSHYIDFYSLNLYPNTDFYNEIYNTDKYIFKSSKATEIRHNLLIHEKMKEKGFKQVISCTYSKYFDKPHTGLYNTLMGEDMLGLGPSARSFIKNRAFRNICSVKDYVKNVSEGISVAETGVIISDDDIIRRNVIMKVNLLKINKNEADILPDIKEKIQRHIELGYIEEFDDYYKVTESGRAWIGNIQKTLFSDNIASSDVNNFLHAIKEGRSAYNQDFMSINKYK